MGLTKKRIDEHLKLREEDIKNNVIKQCAECKEIKNINQFYIAKESSRGSNRLCKKCVILLRNKYYHNSSKARHNHREYYKNKRITDSLWVDNEKKRGKEYRETNRLKVMEKYGNKCYCCGERNPSFLTIEHSFNDGAEHRKRVGNNEKVILDLIRRNFPEDEGIRVACWNCNCARGLKDKCPHLLENQKSNWHFFE